jgi:septum formation protein
MRDLRTIVLASGSPRRLELLGSLGFDVVVRAPGVPEGEIAGLTPRELAEAHARSKGEAAIRTAAPGEVIVAADTVVDVDGAALGKPADAAEAARMLRLLSGRTHVVHTSVVAAAPGLRHSIQRTSSTAVRFFVLEPEEIETYVAGGEPFDKAGGYGIQGRGATLVERIDGDFYTVMGLPLGMLARMLGELGFRLPSMNELSLRP